MMRRFWMGGAALALMAGAAPAQQDSAPRAVVPVDAVVLADRFEYALVSGDGRWLPKTDTFRYTENGVDLPIWDGMWQTLTAVSGTSPAVYPPAAALDYRVQIVDGDQIVRLVETDENSTKGVMALRLRLADGKVAEAEVLPVREEFTGARSGTVSLMQPMVPNTMDGAQIGAADPLFAATVDRPESRAKLETVADRFFADLVSGGMDVASRFTADCIRRDNGRQVTGMAQSAMIDPQQPDFRPYALGCAEQISSGFYSNFRRVRGHRYIIDPARGLVLALVQLDQPGTVLHFDAPGVGRVSYPGPRGAPQAVDTAQQFEGRITENMITPISLNAAFLLKVEGGAIRRIDAFYRAAPYGWRSGW